MLLKIGQSDKEHADIRISPTASFALVFLIQSVLESLILAIPLSLVPVRPFPIHGTTAIGPSIPNTYSETFLRETVFGAYHPYSKEDGERGSIRCCDCGFPRDGQHFSHNRGHPQEEQKTDQPKRHHAFHDNALLGGSFACSRLCLSTSLTSLHSFR